MPPQAVRGDFNDLPEPEDDENGGIEMIDLDAEDDDPLANTGDLSSERMLTRTEGLYRRQGSASSNDIELGNL